MATRGSGKGKARRKRKSAGDINDIYTWTAQDELLSGLPDPTPTVDVDPIALAAWEKDFYTAIANDPAFWAERDANIDTSVEEVIEEDVTTPTQFDSDLLTEILKADMSLINRTLYLLSMLVIYCFIVLPVHIIIWVYQALRRYYYERRSMESSQGEE